MIRKAKDLAFPTEPLSELSSDKCIKIPATNNRTLSHFRKAYQYPDTYEEFLKRQQVMHKEGLKAAQDLVREYLSPEFQRCLMKNNLWEFPYSFPEPKRIAILSHKAPTHEKLDPVSNLLLW